MALCRRQVAYRRGVLFREPKLWVSWAFVNGTGSTTITERGNDEDATWEDLMYRIYIRQAIESGLADVDAGHTLDIKEVRARFGLAT